MSLAAHLCVICVVLCGVRCSLLEWNKDATGNNQCGVEASSNLIHHNPWLVDLEFWRGKGKSLMRCAATLINSHHAVTAAHCVKKSNGFTRIILRLGEYNMDSKRDCVQDVCADPVVSIDAEGWVIHPLYDGSSHDIAILKLKHEAPYTDFIRPICLPTGQLEDNTLFVASGWGELPKRRGTFSAVKKIVPLPYWNKEHCISASKDVRVPDNVICAGGAEGVDTCNGDSGGSLTRIGKVIELWGVTSRGNRNCGTKDSPAFYTNVKDHLDWIHEVMRNK